MQTHNTSIANDNLYALLGSEVVEPSCLLKYESRLDPPISEPSTDLLTFLEYQIRSNSSNLKPYIQRIFLCRHISLNRFLVGSLADLFIVLGTKGSMLKKRMLIVCRPYLDAKEFTVFSHALKNKNKKLDGFQQFEHSIHSSQWLGHTTIIEEPLNQNITAEASSIDLANSYIEHGQLEDAMELLIESVRANPQSSTVAVTLAELLVATKAKKQFNKIYADLKKLDISLPDCWIKTEALMERL